MNTTPIFTKCSCNVCGGHLEFEPAHEGETIACPHCGMETKLYINQALRYRPPARRNSKALFTVTAIVLGIIAALLAVLTVSTYWVTGDGTTVAALFAFVALAALGLVIYFVPTAIAVMRSHRNALGVLLVNFFFGWTLIGWVGALIWSTLAQEKQRIA